MAKDNDERIDMSEGSEGKASGERRLSERRLQALIEASPEVLYRMSPDWGEMRELAGGGFLPDTLDSNRAWLMDYIPSEDQAAVTAAIDRAIQTKALSISNTAFGELTEALVGRSHVLFRFSVRRARSSNGSAQQAMSPIGARPSSRCGT